jgi:hypothetical protein
MVADIVVVNSPTYQPTASVSRRRAEMSQYVHIGILLISVPNLIVIGLMLVVFGLALWLKLPHAGED